MAGSSPSYVDENVLMEILSRLPVKSLVRFRCVSKSWYSLIKSPYFINKHLQQRNLINDNNAPLFILRPNKSISWIYSSSNEAVLDEVQAINLDSLPFSDDELYPVVLGPVNGIYCAVSRSRLAAIKGKEKNIFLCNPALREFKAIPDVPYPPMIEDEEEDSFDGLNTHGFGYDSKTNDFKMVAITRRKIDSQSTCVFVYTLGSNSWRNIDSSNLPALPGLRPAVFLSHGNGVVHWLASDESRRPKVMVILSFNLGTEVFRESLLPDSIIISQKQASLAVFKDRIGVILSHCTQHEIWVMKEYGVEESWTKLYNFEPLLGDIRPLRFWKHDEILSTHGDEYGERKLVSYDPSCEKIKDLCHIGDPLQVVTYMESLVSINKVVLIGPTKENIQKKNPMKVIDLLFLVLALLLLLLFFHVSSSFVFIFWFKRKNFIQLKRG